MTTTPRNELVGPWLDAVGHGVAVYDADGLLIGMNARLADLIGRDPDADYHSQLPPSWWPPEDALELAMGIAELRSGGPPLRWELAVRSERGPGVVASVTWDAARSADGELLGFLVTVEDITERLLVEEAWTEARRTYELLADNSTDLVTRISSSLRLLYVSPSVLRVLGYPIGEVMGARLARFVHRDDLGALREALAALEGGADGVTTVIRIRHRDGRWLWFEIVTHALRDEAGRIIETQASARDVSARRAVEDRNRQFAEELGFVARHAGDMISAHNPDGTFRTVSDASRTLLGRSPEDLVGASAAEFLHPDDRERYEAVFARVSSGAATIESITHRVVKPDGSALWLDTSIRAMRSIEGELTACICVSRDATARRAVEREASNRAKRSELEAIEQTALRRVAMAVAHQADAPPVLEMVAEEIPRLLRVAGGLVVRFDDHGGVVLGASEAMPWTPGDRILTADGSALDLLRRGGRTARALAPLVSPDGEITVTSTVSAPVRIDDDLWGAVVAVSHQGGTVPAGAEARLERFAELVSVAVVAAENRAQLAAQALSDPLTGLANHRAFHERLREEVARAHRYGRPLSLAVIDIDHFKRLNDLHGHQAGDAVLASLGGMLSGTARASELVARVGGEEFAWLLPETDGDIAMRAVERFRAAVSRQPLWRNERITVSAGISDLIHAADADDLYRLADGALYWAKGNGRDQVCLYSPEVVDALSIEERALRLERTQTIAALRSLARAVDAKDTSTKAHSERVAELAHRLALALGWTRARADKLKDAALLHDVGKLGIPDAVLFKPGDLEPAEYESVKRHAALGAEITADALTAEQCEWIRHHHEHWDGGGYPGGVSGEGIPEGARLIAVADAWDVMTRARHYGTVKTVDEALEEIDRCSGAQFWPAAVDAMKRVIQHSAPARIG